MEPGYEKLNKDDFIDKSEIEKDQNEINPAKKQYVHEMANSEESICEYTTRHMSTLAYPREFPWGENCVFDDIEGLEAKDQPS